MATEDMQLGNRTFNALQKLLSYKSLLHLTYELESLDTTTKWSPESCVTITRFGAIDILIQILNESNRSEPHKNIIIFSLSILLNLAKVSFYLLLFKNFIIYFYLLVRKYFKRISFKLANHWLIIQTHQSFQSSKWFIDQMFFFALDFDEKSNYTSGNIGIDSLRIWLISKFDF